MPRKKAMKPIPPPIEGAVAANAYLEPGDIEKLEKAASNVRDSLLIRLLSHLGCRISEVLAITLEDIDLNKGTVTIQHLKTRLKLTCPHCNSRLGASHAFCPGCGEKVDNAVAKAREHRRLRTLHLDEESLEMLRYYINRGGAGSPGGRQPILGITRHRAWQVIKECAIRAGLPPLINPGTGRVRGISPHRLRDSFAVMAVQQDDSTDGIRMLQEWLGHASIATTMHYRKVAGRELKEWYEKLWDRRKAVDG